MPYQIAREYGSGWPPALDAQAYYGTATRPDPGVCTLLPDTYPTEAEMDVALADHICAERKSLDVEAAADPNNPWFGGYKLTTSKSWYFREIDGKQYKVIRTDDGRIGTDEDTHIVYLGLEI